jgi:predicted enzyme related to lactoylglutathione lyase
VAKYEVDYFELPAKDAGMAGDFFAKAFGWTLKSYGPSYTELGAGIVGGLNADAGDRPKAPLIGIRTDDIAAAEAAVVAAGGTITRPTYDFPGGKRFYFREPGGSELLVYMPTE